MVKRPPLSTALACRQDTGRLRKPPRVAALFAILFFLVRDANGQALVYIYSRDNEDEARQAKVLTKDEARRIAVNVARLPQLLGKAD